MASFPLDPHRENKLKIPALFFLYLKKECATALLLFWITRKQAREFSTCSPYVGPMDTKPWNPLSRQRVIFVFWPTRYGILTGNTGDTAIWRNFSTTSGKNWISQLNSRGSEMMEIDAEFWPMAIWREKPEEYKMWQNSDLTGFFQQWLFGKNWISLLKSRIFVVWPVAIWR